MNDPDAEGPERRNTFLAPSERVSCLEEGGSILGHGAGCRPAGAQICIGKRLDVMDKSHVSVVQCGTTRILIIISLVPLPIPPHPLPQIQLASLFVQPIHEASFAVSFSSLGIGLSRRSFLLR